MKARVSVAVAGLVALLSSYSSSETVTTAEATNSTSTIASASSSSNFTYVDVLGCYEEIFCEDESRLGCHGSSSSLTDFTNLTDFTGSANFTGSTESIDFSNFTESTRFTELAEYMECIRDINYNYNSTTVSYCHIYSKQLCCLPLLDDLEGSSKEQIVGYYACILDAYECSSEYYSCVEGIVAQGSASNDAAVTTGNGQPSSRLVCAAFLIFTVAFAMFM